MKEPIEPKYNPQCLIVLVQVIFSHGYIAQQLEVINRASQFFPGQLRKIQTRTNGILFKITFTLSLSCVVSEALLKPITTYCASSCFFRPQGYSVFFSPTFMIISTTQLDRLSCFCFFSFCFITTHILDKQVASYSRKASSMIIIFIIIIIIFFPLSLLCLY